MPADEPIVRIENVVKDFGPLRVLDGVGFDVARGQTVAIVGRSGSGKSTLLRCIAFLEEPTAGLISIYGEPLGFALTDTELWGRVPARLGETSSAKGAHEHGTGQRQERADRRCTDDSRTQPERGQAGYPSEESA